MEFNEELPYAHFDETPYSKLQVLPQVLRVTSGQDPVNSIYRSVLYLVDKFSVGNEEKAMLFTPGALNEPKFLGVSEYLGQGPIAGPFGITTYDGLVSILPQPASDSLNVHEFRSVTFFGHNFGHRYDARFLPPPVGTNITSFKVPLLVDMSDGAGDRIAGFSVIFSTSAYQLLFKHYKAAKELMARTSFPGGGNLRYKSPFLTEWDEVLQDVMREGRGAGLVTEQALVPYSGQAGQVISALILVRR